MIETRRQQKTRSQFVLGWAKKIILIDSLGGKCSFCGIDDIRVLCFHHEHNKEFIVGNSRQNRLSKGLSEAKKCKLLCQNCHRELHSVKCRIGQLIKEELLRIKGSSCCSKCGYNKSTSALTFHHVSGIKLFNLGDVVAKKLSLTQEILTEEVNKCIVICVNCHLKEHFHGEKFNKYEEQIRNKVLTYKEQNRIDRGQVISLFESGMAKKAIARKLSLPNSSIRYVIKKYLEKK